jgi:hypothetical protein
VIPPAQAPVLAECDDDVAIATTNMAHSSRFAEVRNWDEITEAHLN